MVEIIKQIHESDTKLNLIEIGAGCPVASKLFEIEGASNTVLCSSSPYSKEAQSKFLSNNHRSVSFETVKDIINFNSENIKHSIFATSFQLTSQGCSHGWIGFKHRNTEKYYHITIPSRFTRIKAIEEIGNLGIQIIRYKNKYNENIISELQFDIINDENGNYIIDDLINAKQPEILCFSHGKCVRKEEILRGVNSISILKGSFNPWHDGHEQLCTKLSPTDDDTIIAISIDTFGKNKILPSELHERLTNLLKLKKRILVFTKPLFTDNISTLRKYNPNLIIKFVVGMDTLNRIATSVFHQNEPNFKSVKFIVFERPNIKINEEAKELIKTKQILCDFPQHIIPLNISSTEIRNNKLNIHGHKI